MTFRSCATLPGRLASLSASVPPATELHVIDNSVRLLVDNVPVHLEARPLVRDPRDSATLYAGFSITPYETLWRSAADGASPLQRLDAINVAGGLAFLLLLGLVAGVILRQLGRYYSRPDGLGMRQSPSMAAGQPYGDRLHRSPDDLTAGITAS